MELKNNPEEIELNDQFEFQQLMGDPPGWILRYGIGTIFFVLCVLGGIIYFVEYPDLVPTQLELTTDNPPIPVIAETDGQLAALQVDTDQNVQAGDYLGMIASTAVKKDIDQLDSFLLSISNLEADEIVEKQLPRRLKLGPIQGLYTTFTQSVAAYLDYKKSSQNYQKIRNLNSRIARVREENKVIASNRALLADQIQMAKENVTRFENLYKSEAAAKIKIEEAQKALFFLEENDNNLERQRIQNQSLILQYKEQKIQLKETDNSDILARERAVEENIDNLVSQIASWRKAHLIVAPITGQVAFTKKREINQFIATGEAILTIVPQNGTSEIIARGTLNAVGAGKVTPQDTVNIKLQDYPYREFGMLKGVVQHISLVPDQEGYIVEISVPDTLLTSQNKVIQFRQGMQGTGNIITENRKLWQRILSEFKGLWER